MNRIITRFTLFVFSTLALVSCGQKDEDELQAEMESGLVMVQNSGYYELMFSDNEKIYFSGLEEDGSFENFSLTSDSIVPEISYGTGFIVSDDGQIATNYHVVHKEMDEKSVQKSMKTLIKSLQTIMSYKYDKLSEIESTLQSEMLSKFAYDQDYSEEASLLETVQKEMTELQESYKELGDIDITDTQLRYINDVSIAYNNTHVTSTEDFISCVITRQDPEHDLAIIQLKDKKTPEGKFIFPIPGKDPLESYSLMEKIAKKVGTDKNESLYMSGYNLGPLLAITEDGVKAQFNKGSVSQKTSDRLLYSIPALHGSSGSPVVNNKGELVAINYASTSDAQNFNYGIRVKHLYNLLNQ